MNFSKALALLKEGNKVTSKTWQTYYLDKAKMEMLYLYTKDGFIYTQSKQEDYKGSQALLDGISLLSEDWEIYEEDKVPEYGTGYLCESREPAPFDRVKRLEDEVQALKEYMIKLRDGIRLALL